MKLGENIRRIRQLTPVKLSPGQLQALKSLGFTWVSVLRGKSQRTWEDSIMVALQTYRRLKGDLKVPQCFTIPDKSEEWPQGTRGLKLGQVVNRIRQGKYASAVARDREILDKLGFIWKARTAVVENTIETWEEQIIPALEVYRKVKGDLLVPVRFIVPKNDASWPKKTWGLRLGKVVNGLRHGRYQRSMNHYKNRLDSLGFVWDLKSVGGPRRRWDITSISSSLSGEVLKSQNIPLQPTQQYSNVQANVSVVPMPPSQNDGYQYGYHHSMH